MIYDTLSAKWRSLTAVNHPYLGASPGVNRQQENIAGKAVPSVGRWLAPGAVAHRHQAATNGHPSRMLTCGPRRKLEHRQNGRSRHILPLLHGAYCVTPLQNWRLYSRPGSFLLPMWLWRTLWILLSRSENMMLTEGRRSSLLCQRHNMVTCKNLLPSIFVGGR